MGKIVKFIFAVDVSGSMLGRRIGAVNAALAECIEDLHQICSSGSADVQVSLITYSDSVTLEKSGMAPGDLHGFKLNITPRQNGFYSVTLLSSLLKGLQALLSRPDMDDRSGGSQTYILLLTDGRAVDPEAHGRAFDLLERCPAFAGACRYAAVTDEHGPLEQPCLMRFVGSDSSHLCRISDITDIMSLIHTGITSGSSREPFEFLNFDNYI